MCGCTLIREQFIATSYLYNKVDHERREFEIIAKLFYFIYRLTLCIKALRHLYKYCTLKTDIFDIPLQKESISLNKFVKEMNPKGFCEPTWFVDNEFNFFSLLNTNFFLQIKTEYFLFYLRTFTYLVISVHRTNRIKLMI